MINFFIKLPKPARTVNIITILFLVLFSMFTSSCGIFDKELEQDKQIANFRRQMGRALDTLDTPKDRIAAFQSILEQIDKDKKLITERKKNMLLIEGNALISNEYLNIENFKQAIKYADIIIGIDSTAPKVYYTRGCIYQAMNKDSLALLDYGKALLLNPDYASASYNSGIIYEEQEKYDQALANYNKAIKQKPSYIADIYNNRGNVYLAKESFDNAVSDYSEVLNIDSVNVKAYSNRAGAYILMADLDNALSDCNNAIRLDSLGLNAYVKRASIFESKKLYNEALDDYKKIIKLDPRDKHKTHEMAQEAIQRLRPLAKKNNK